MAFRYGNIATVELDNAIGTLTDYSGYLSSASMSSERETTDLPRLGGNQTAQLAGGPATTFEIEGYFDPTLDAILGAWALAADQTAKSFRYGPQGSASGAVKYEAEVFLSEYSPETSADDAGTFSATLLVNEDGVTRGTFS